MGLDNIVQCEDENGDKSSKINESVGILFEKCKNVCNISKDKENQYHIMLSGGMYKDIVYRTSNISLSNDLDSESLLKISDGLNHFIELHDHMLGDLNEAYEKYSYAIDSWVESATKYYVPSPKQIIELSEFFKICANNNLFLYAW